MFGPENGVRIYLALENVYGMLVLWLHAFSPSELQDLYVVYLKKVSHKGAGGGGGRGVTGTPGPLLGYAPDCSQLTKQDSVIMFKDTFPSERHSIHFCLGTH